ncbi:hypothetical protein H2201_002075 [Coniosporium apollinis]|uniref:Tetratricopeptide SHNi-TPR domain-containing protein n=1 Tax=Coniosporium apollinis TaxID=61459 RepID=A0ABQ9NZV7_9PEZI|nr:hypothetical protein H2201_002075 [Coniosporium apollinis]
MANAPAPPDTGALASDHMKLHELTTAASLQYKLKNYTAAADLFSDALELQDQVYGEMAPENAELLYQYGRCLFHVAVSSSDVLGGKITGEEKTKPKSRPKKRDSKGADEREEEGREALPSAERVAEEVVEAAVEERESMKPAAEDGVENKPFFQITGDDNWLTDEDDEEGEEAEDGEANAGEDDDFAIAYEILDSARVLLSRQLDALKTDTGNRDASVSANKRNGQALDDAGIRQIKERLAEIHDLQGEISLENERFQDAVNELRACLAVRKELYPEESALLAEGHYKLALALEMSSVYAIRDAQRDTAEGKVAGDEPEVDEDLLAEAAKEMEAAISSCKLRIKKGEAELATMDPVAQETQKQSIKDVNEMVEEMQQRVILFRACAPLCVYLYLSRRLFTLDNEHQELYGELMNIITQLHDLRNPPSRMPAVIGPAGAPDGNNPLNGVLGSLLGESSAEQKARIEQATKSANDLSGLVRHKKKPVEADQGIASVANGSGKRKLGDEDDQGRERAKSARIDEA